MTFDFSKLIPAGETILAAGLPSIGTLLSKVVPFPFSLAVEPLFNSVASALNVDPAASDAPAQVQAAVEADPAAAAAKLAPIESSHKEMADAANDELRLRLLDVQDARATNVEYVKAGSFMQAVPGIWALIMVSAFLATLAVLLMRPITLTEAVAAIVNLLVGVLIGEVARAGNFFLGSSQSSRLRADQAIDFAHKAASPPLTRKGR